MQGTFENVTRLALEEIILEQAKESKFGYVMTEDGFQNLVNKLHEFFLVSRNMRTMGERVLNGQQKESGVSVYPRRR